MTTPDSIFGPELEGLLQEAAQDPKSCLLREPRPPVVLTPYDPIRRLSAARAGLSNVDRHILQVHRQELAFRLRQLCVMMIEDLEMYSLCRSPVRRKATSDSQDGFEKWKTDVRLVLGVGRSSFGTSDAQEIEPILSSPGLRGLSLARLARLSALIAGSTTASILEAYDHYARRRYDVSLGILEPLIRSPMSAVNRGSVLQGIVSAHIRQGRFHEARAWSRQSCQMQSGNSSPYYNQLLVGLGCLDFGLARISAEALNDLVKGHESALDSLVDSVRGQVSKGLLLLPRASAELLRRLQDEIGSPVGAILDAAACSA